LNFFRRKVLEAKEDSQWTRMHDLSSWITVILRRRSKFDHASFSLMETEFSQYRNSNDTNGPTFDTSQCMIYTHCAHHFNVRHIRDTLLQKLCNALRPTRCLIGVKPRVGRVFLLGIHFEGSACLRKYINMYARVSGGY